MFCVLLIAEVLQGIGPQKVAHGPECGGLFEAVELKHMEIQHHQLIDCPTWREKPPHCTAIHSRESRGWQATHLPNIV